MVAKGEKKSCMYSGKFTVSAGNAHIMQNEGEMGVHNYVFFSRGTWASSKSMSTSVPRQDKTTALILLAFYKE